MKQKILPFIIGCLVGAIVATIGFYFYEKAKNSEQENMQNNIQSDMEQQENDNSILNVDIKTDKNTTTENTQGEPPKLPSGEQENGSQGGTPPEKPSGEQGGRQQISTDLNSNNI